MNDFYKVKHNYTDLSYIKVLISSADLGFVGLNNRAKTSSRDQPKVAFNSIGPLLLNYEKMKNIFPHNRHV